MKKVFVTFAVVAMMFAAASCGNKNAKKAETAEPAAVEQAAPAAEGENCCVKDAVEQAANEVAVEAINAAAEKAKEAINK